MNTLYFQVISPDLSIAIDDYVGYYHHFEVGDILKVIFNDSGKYHISTVNDKVFDFCGISNQTFIHEWNKTVSSRGHDVRGIVHKKYLLDITTSIERNNKINDILK